MHSIFTCLISGFSSVTKQQRSFLKKPLVAISLLVIITMCLTFAEAAPRPYEHRRRHHRRLESMALRTKEENRNGQRNGKQGMYKVAVDAITRRLKHNMRNYVDDLRAYKGRKEMSEAQGKTEWLPKINFVKIHFKRFNSIKSRFKYVMPKLFKHVRDCRAIFEVLLNDVNISYSGNLYYQLRNRNIFLNATLTGIDLLLTDMNDSMNSVNLSIPDYGLRINLTSLHINVDSTEYDFQDKIAFRAYENLLRKWKQELICWRKNPSSKRTPSCTKYEQEMEKRRVSQRPRKTRDIILSETETLTQIRSKKIKL